jgi:hypothetical protein
MPRFHFNLRACGTIHWDTKGVECADAAEARAHAVTVARELMRSADGGTRHWSFRVEEGNGETLFDVFFADVVGSREPLPPALQELVALTCRRQAALIDALCAVRATVAECQIVRARATRKPQLVFSRAGSRFQRRRSGREQALRAKPAMEN